VIPEHVLYVTAEIVNLYGVCESDVPLFVNEMITMSRNA
jgi:hypothetical protein